MNGYEIIETTADVGIDVTADSVDALFTLAARGMLDIMGLLDINSDSYKFSKRITLSGTMEDWLVDVLTAILGEMEFDEIFFSNVFIIISNNMAEIKFAMSHRRPVTDIKAVTYHNLVVRKNDRIYTTRIIFDV